MDIWPASVPDPSGMFSSTPDRFVAAGASSFIGADDANHGDELWISDGTDSGTTVGKDIVLSGNDHSYPMPITGFGGKVYCWARYAANDDELWVTDGTTAGTVMVAPVNPSTSEMVAVGGRLFFKDLDSSNDLELWRLPLDDIVTAPETPDGASEANTGIASTYATSGSVSLNGNRVQYRFDWSDGSHSG